MSYGRSRVTLRRTHDLMTSVLVDDRAKCRAVWVFMGAGRPRVTSQLYRVCRSPCAERPGPQNQVFREPDPWPASLIGGRGVRFGRGAQRNSCRQESAIDVSPGNCCVRAYVGARTALAPPARLRTGGSARPPRSPGDRPEDGDAVDHGAEEAALASLRVVTCVFRSSDMQPTVRPHLLQRNPGNRGSLTTRSRPTRGSGRGAKESRELRARADHGAKRWRRGARQSPLVSEISRRRLRSYGRRMSEFVVESYSWCEPASVAPRVEEIARVAERLTEDGMQVRLLCAAFLLEEKICFYVFESSSAEAVREAATRAGLSF